MARSSPPPAFAPLWVYLFGCFAVAALQRVVFPPDEHSTAANLAFFAVGAAFVIVALTIAEHAKRRR